MRQLSTNVAPLLEGGSAETIYLVRITDKDGVAIFTSTTHHDDVTLSDGRTYEANGLLVSADPPQLSATVDREQYKVTIADPTFIQGSLAEAGITGKNLEVVLGFIDPVTGVPFTNAVDTFVVYRGKVDGASYKIDTAEYGESLLQVTGVSPILSLENKRGLYLSKDAVRRRNPKDSSCDQLYEGSTAVTLKWGKV